MQGELESERRPAAERPPRRRARLQDVSWRAALPLAAALVLGLGTLYLIHLTARPIALLILAITLAEALAPVVRRLHRRMPLPVAVTIVYALLLLVVGAIGWLVLPVLVTEIHDLADRAPRLIARARATVAQWDQITGGRLAGALASMATTLSGALVHLPMAILSGLVDLALVVFLSIYWLLGSATIERFALSLLPQRHRDRARSVLSEMGRSMGGYVRGVVIDAFIMGVLAWLGLWLIGLQYAVILGVLTMVGEFVPYIGPILVMVPVAGIGLLQSTTTALLALALYIALEQLEGHILTPNIMETQTDLPQTLVIFALAAGAALGGLLGVLVSIPVAAAARVFMLRVVAPAERREVGAVDPAAVTRAPPRPPSSSDRRQSM